MSLRVLGIVPARGGSKAIPRKNIVDVLGKPLIAYTADAALNSHLQRVVLSTDDAEIAAVGAACGLDVPFLRPAELARDETPTIPVLQHVVKALADAGSYFDAVMTLQPTNPLRLPSDIDGAIALLERSGADSVISVFDVGEKHPARMKYMDADGRLVDPPFAEAREGQRRQDLPKMFLRDGAIYLTRTHVLMEAGSLKGADCRGWVMPADRAFNVDEPLDLMLIEQALLRMKGRGELP